MDTITKNDFEAYEEIRKSGVTNMLDIRKVAILSLLSEKKVLDIIKNYSKYEEKYLS